VSADLDIPPEALRQHLAVAIERVADAYRRSPSPPDVNDETWLGLEASIDAALATRDPELAVAAVTEWEQHASDALGIDHDG
jgi:surfactin synthase thioesterase subunit